MVKLQEIYVTQRKLRNVDQLPQMLEAIANGDLLPQVRLAEFENGSIHIEDGHHRCLSYWLSGRETLDEHEYVLILKDEQDRVRFGKLVDLHGRVVELADTQDSKSCAVRREGSSPSSATL